MKLIKLSAILAVMGLAACSNTQVQEPSSAESLNIYAIEPCQWQNGDEGAPSWSCNPVPADDKFVAFAVGTAKTSKYDVTLSKNTAMADAQAELRRQFEASVEKGIRSATQSTGALGTNDETYDAANSQVLNVLVSGSVKNSRLLKTKNGPDGYTYALMGIAREGFSDLVSSSVNSSMGNAKAQYQMLLTEKIQQQFDQEFLNTQQP
jgi:hypothetical protein